MHQITVPHAGLTGVLLQYNRPRSRSYRASYGRYHLCNIWKLPSANLTAVFQYKLTVLYRNAVQMHFGRNRLFLIGKEKAVGCNALQNKILLFSLILNPICIDEILWNKGCTVLPSSANTGNAIANIANTDRIIHIFLFKFFLLLHLISSYTISQNASSLIFTVLHSISISLFSSSQIAL